LVLLILDGATNLLTARVVESEAAEVTLQAFRECMDNFQCCPKALVSDMAFQRPDFQRFCRYHGIKPTATGPRTPWPNRAERASSSTVQKATRTHDTIYGAEEPSLRHPAFKSLVQTCCWARNNQLTIARKHHLSWPLECHQKQFVTLNMKTQRSSRRIHPRQMRMP